jgi:hypothetical protein
MLRILGLVLLSAGSYQPDWISSPCKKACESFLCPANFSKVLAQLPGAGQAWLESQHIALLGRLQFQDWRAEFEEASFLRWPASIKDRIEARDVIWSQTGELLLPPDSREGESGLTSFRLVHVKMSDPEAAIFIEIAGQRIGGTQASTRQELERFCRSQLTAFSKLPWLVQKESCQISVVKAKSKDFWSFGVQFPALRFEGRALDLGVALAKLY